MLLIVHTHYDQDAAKAQDQADHLLEFHALEHLLKAEPDDVQH